MDELNPIHADDNAGRFIAGAVFRALQNSQLIFPRIDGHIEEKRSVSSVLMVEIRQAIT